jgi:hypothetical protein
MKEYKHWAEELEVGDKCLATIRHKTDGEKNLHNVEVIVVEKWIDTQQISAWFPPHFKVLVPYNDLKPLTHDSRSPT